MQGDIVETIIAINLQSANAQFDADTKLRKEFPDTNEVLLEFVIGRQPPSRTAALPGSSSI